MRSRVKVGPVEFLGMGRAPTDAEITAQPGEGLRVTITVDFAKAAIPDDEERCRAEQEVGRRLAEMCRRAIPKIVRLRPAAPGARTSRTGG